MKSIAMLLALLFEAGLAAQDAPDTALATNQLLAAATNLFTGNTATNPVPRPTNTTNWFARHENFLKIAKAGGIDLLFLGDSITDHWKVQGSNVWARYYAPRHAANFGIGGDRTENVLWRIEHGELDSMHPKVIVLLIGTNNTGKGRNTVPEIIEGVTAVVKSIRLRRPETKILFLGIFPRGNLDSLQRAQVALVNSVVAKLDDEKMVKFLDIGPKFLEADGTLPKTIMPDLLHPVEKGYEIWAEAMEPTLAEMLK